VRIRWLCEEIGRRSLDGFFRGEVARLMMGMVEIETWSIRDDDLGQRIAPTKLDARRLDESVCANTRDQYRKLSDLEYACD